ncbi:uncharacterized protein (UPF0371 family) [Bradyrhizobium sp. USDA 3311]
MVHEVQVIPPAPQVPSALTEEDIRRIVRAVLDVENAQHLSNLDDVVLKAVATILTSFGIEEDDRKELKADFVHLRKWRKSYEQVERVTWTAAIGIVVTGFAAAVWAGIKVLAGKP